MTTDLLQTAGLNGRTHATRSALAGVAAGAVMGVMLTMQMTPVIAGAIPGLYGLSGMAAGWAVHLVHSAVFGVLFAAIASRGALQARMDGIPSAAAIGAGYGVAVWAVFAVVLMPVWMGAVGLQSPGVPNVNPQSLIGHLVFGVVLGAVYTALTPDSG